MSRPNVTLRDVAARAGVSATTVSSALRGSGRMKAALRQRIERIAREMGYQVDPIISAGMAQMRLRPEKRVESALAWLDATPSRHSVEKNPIFRLVWQGAGAQAASLGYNLERFWLNDPDMPASRLARILRSRGIEGVVVLQYYDEAPEGPIDFDFTGFACASVTTRLAGPDIPFAQSDLFACTALAMRELGALGYRRIGLVCPPSVDALTQHRVSSAYEGYVRLHPDLRHVPVFVDESRQEQARLFQWLKSEKPEVVMGWKPPGEFRRLGFRVPQELGVCMLDHLEEFGDCAGVHQNHAEIGAAGIRLVHAQMQQGIRGVPQFATATMLEGQWVPGGSLRALPRRARGVNKRTRYPDTKYDPPSRSRFRSRKVKGS